MSIHEPFGLFFGGSQSCTVLRNTTSYDLHTTSAVNGFRRVAIEVEAGHLGCAWQGTDLELPRTALLGVAGVALS